MDLQFLQSELKRVSEWIQLSDKKTAFVSVYYSAIFGLLTSYKESILENLKICKSWSDYIFFLLLVAISISSILGLYLIFKAIFPRLKNICIDESLFYFSHISNMKFKKFSEAFSKMNKKDAEELIIEQIYTNSVIAKCTS